MARRAQSGEVAVVAGAARQEEVPAVARVLYAPVKLVSRRIAPRVSKRVFRGLWSAIDRGGPPPRPDEPEVSVGKLALALGLEGACTAVVRGVLDQVSRRQFARLTGRWPGRRTKR